MSEDCQHCVFEKNEANCRGCFEGSHYRPKPQTNADRIRAMTDEELAETFSEIADCVVCETRIKADCRPHGGKTPCKTVWMEWLRQEANT